MQAHFSYFVSVNFYREAILLGIGGHHFDDVADGLVYIAEGEGVFFSTSLDSGEVKDVFNQSAEPFAFLSHIFVILCELFL